MAGLAESKNRRGVGYGSGLFLGLVTQLVSVANISLYFVSLSSFQELLT